MSWVGCLSSKQQRGTLSRWAWQGVLCWSSDAAQEPLGPITIPTNLLCVHVSPLQCLTDICSVLAEVLEDSEVRAIGLDTATKAHRERVLGTGDLSKGSAS